MTVIHSLLIIFLSVHQSGMQHSPLSCCHDNRTHPRGGSTTSRDLQPGNQLRRRHSLQHLQCVQDSKTRGQCDALLHSYTSKHIAVITGKYYATLMSPNTGETAVCGSAIFCCMTGEAITGCRNRTLVPWPWVNFILTLSQLDKEFPLITAIYASHQTTSGLLATGLQTEFVHWATAYKFPILTQNTPEQKLTYCTTCHPLQTWVATIHAFPTTIQPIHLVESKKA